MHKQESQTDRSGRNRVVIRDESGAPIHAYGLIHGAASVDCEKSSTAADAEAGESEEEPVTVLAGFNRDPYPVSYCHKRSNGYRVKWFDPGAAPPSSKASKGDDVVLVIGSDSYEGRVTKRDGGAKVALQIRV